MADGPQIEKLFRDMQCLNAEHNLADICKYLNFAKDEEGNYQLYLKHYLPMLPKEQFDEYVEGVCVVVDGKEDKKATASAVEAITAKWEEKHVPQPTPEALEVTAKLEAEKEAAKAAKKAEKEAAKAKKVK